MILQNTTHWHTGPTRPPIIVIIAGDTPRLDELVSRADDLLYTVSRLLELLLVLIAIVLAGMEVMVSMVNRVIAKVEQVDRWFNSLFMPLSWTPIRGLG